jgi:hypothetical protein
VKIKRKKKKWNSSPIMIKAAIIGGFFVIFGAICTIIPMLLTIYPQLSDEVRRSKSPPVRIEYPGIALASEIHTNINGQSYSVVPTSCWMVTQNDATYTYYNLSSITALLQFMITGVDDTVVKVISVVLDEMESSPPQSNVHNVLITPGLGIGGQITPIELPGKPQIGNSFLRGELTELDVYSFSRDEIINFIAILEFLEPGQFQFHLEVLARPLDGEDIILTSEKIDFRWLYVDLENVQTNIPISSCE